MQTQTPVFNWTQVFTAIAGAVFYGVGVRIFDKWFTNADKRVDASSELQRLQADEASELRRVAIEEAQSLRRELRDCRNTSFKIQQSFLDLQVNYNSLKNDYEELESERDNLKKQFDNINTMLDGLKIEARITRNILQQVQFHLPKDFKLEKEMKEILEKDQE